VRINVHVFHLIEIPVLWRLHLVCSNGLQNVKQFVQPNKKITRTKSESRERREMASDNGIVAFILISCFIGLAFALINWLSISSITYAPNGYTGVGDHSEREDSKQTELVSKAEHQNDLAGKFKKVEMISGLIYDGAHAFLYREYAYIAVFMTGFFFVILIAVGHSSGSWARGGLTAVAFLFGAVTSVISGLIGMKVATLSNGRTAIKGTDIGAAFTVAFKGGAVMGFALVSLGLLVLMLLIGLYYLYWFDVPDLENPMFYLYSCVSGYGLGASSVALFGRVGGGIYTKAADVGADLVGKVEKDIPEDDPRNPATIADNVGDNVGDIAGMGADLFGSFAESTCAALIIAAESDAGMPWSVVSFPLLITAIGILTSIATALIAFAFPPRSDRAVEVTLKYQLGVSTLANTICLAIAVSAVLPARIQLSQAITSRWSIYACAVAGLWAGLIIGFVTEYYTSKAYKPVQEVARASETGAATNIIYGLALGYESVIIPVLSLCVSVYISFSLAGAYGVSIAALGVLSNMCTGLAIDGFGPISDNAGGIAEMSELGPEFRENTDALDAAGNTTAAVGKGFAIASAAFVSLALFSAFITTVQLKTVDLLQPMIFAGLLYGGMLPYWFSAMTVKSVGKAALSMVEEVRRQFHEHPGIMNGTEKPDYSKCIQISTDASLKEMIPPGCLVMLSPLIVGYLFGYQAQAGVLAGTLISGVQLSISSTNTGGAWDNAKKYIEAGSLGPDKKKGSAVHKAAVIGDTVGDPLKDTSGPALNILIKLSAILSLVFASSFPATGYLIQLFGGK
jgi:H(+)-translocating pyrophosphatase